MEQAGVSLIAQGAAAYMSDMKSATNATNGFVDTTDKGAGIVSRAGGMMGSAIKNVAAIAAGIGVAGFVALGKSIIDGVGDAREAAKLYASTEQTIKTMGNAAGRSAQDVVDLATALSDASGMSLFGDDQIQASENLLLTFSNIKGETFDLATALTVDLAQALGGAPADQAMMLGKALNDPIKGITALGKAGLTFSEEQKAAIAAMVKTGDMAGAQSIIIEELNRQVGGQAQAAAQADGGWTQLTATLGELQESVGAAVLPMLNVLVGMLNESVMPVVTAVAEAFGGVIESLADAGVMSSEFGESVGYLATQLGLPGELIQDIVFGVQGVVEAFEDAGAMSSEFGESIGYLASQLGLPGELVQDIVFAVQDLVASFQEGGAASASLGSAVDDLSGIWMKASDVVANVMDAYMAIATAVLPVVTRFVDEHGEEISAFFKQTWDSIIQIVTLALQVYNGIVPPILNAIAGFIDAHGSEIVKILTGAWEIVSSLITGVLDTIKGIFTTTLAIINGDWEGAWAGIKTIADAQMNAITGVITGFLDMIAGIFDTNMGDITKTWENNWNMLIEIANKVGAQMVEAGANIVSGIIEGIENNASAIYNVLSDIADGAVQAFLDAIGAGSPAKAFMPAGEYAVQGVMQGMEGMLPALLDLVNQTGGSMIEALTKNISKGGDEIRKMMADLTADIKDISSQINDAIADGFGATASIDRQIAKNLDKFKDIPDQYKQYTEGALKEAQNQAAAFADPTQGAKFFKMRSDQILEYAKLQQDLAEAETQEDADRINAQMILINKAQTEEIRQWEAMQAGMTTPQQDITSQIQELLHSNDVAGKLPALTENAIMSQLYSLLGQLQTPNDARQQSYVNPPMQASQYAWQAPQTSSSSSTYNMPIYTNNSPAALQQSLAVLQASMA